MRKKLLLRYLLLCLLLFFSAGWSVLSFRSELWMGFAGGLLMFVTCAAYAWYIMTVPLRAIHNYILNKCGTAGGGLQSSYVGIYETERVLDDLMANCREQSFVEAGRREFYELVLRQVQTGVVACAKDGRIEWMNRSAEELLGVLRHVDAAWLDETLGTERVVLLNWRNHNREVLLARLPFREGNEDKLLFTLRDVRHVLEIKQQESWKSLSRVLTHEIMNSMTPILSLADTLALRASESDAPDAATILHLQQGLEVIRRRGHGLLDFVNNYRQLTRVSPPQMDLISADELFDGLCCLFPMPFIEFVQPYRKFAFRADRAQLEQVLINLIKNALEAATVPDSPVSVMLERNAAHREVCISVRDSGQGISQAEQEHVFMPFYTTKPGGTGIGLSLCKQIISNHGGDILLHSVQDKGSCFTICLPWN